MVLQDVAHYFALQSRKPLTAARKKTGGNGRHDVSCQTIEGILQISKMTGHACSGMVSDRQR